MYLRLVFLFLTTSYILRSQSLNAFSRLTPATVAELHISRIIVRGTLLYRSDRSPLLPITYEFNRDGYPVSYPVQYQQATCYIERRADNRPTFMYYAYRDHPGKDTLFLMQYVYNAENRLSKVYDFLSGELTTVHYDSQGRVAEITAYHFAAVDSHTFKPHRFEGSRRIDSIISPACRMYIEKMKYKKGKVKIVERSASTRRYTLPDSSFHADRRIAGDLMQTEVPRYEDNDYYSPICKSYKPLRENETAMPNECFIRLNSRQQVIEKVFYDNTSMPNDHAMRKRHWLISYDGDLPQKMIVHRMEDDKELSSIGYEVEYEYFR